MTARSPHLDGVLDEIAETADSAEVRIVGLSSSGLLAALLLNAIAVSWASHETWNTPLLAAEFHRLSFDGELIQNEVEIRHASRSEHWAHHRVCIEQEQMASVTTGEELWTESPELFPHLEFCGQSERQIREFTGNEKHFAWVVRCLTLANLQVVDGLRGLSLTSCCLALLPGRAFQFIIIKNCASYEYFGCSQGSGKCLNTT